MTPELQKQYEQDRDAEIRHVAIMPIVAKAMKNGSDFGREYTLKQMEGEMKKAHFHGWFQRERLDSPDKCGYENQFPSNWHELDYEEKEEWFFKKFIEENSPPITSKTIQP